MSATNDSGVKRYALPGVPTPILPADIVNKAYADANPHIRNFKAITQTVNNSEVQVNSVGQSIVLPIGIYFVTVVNLMNGTAAADMKQGFTFSGTVVFSWAVPSLADTMLDIGETVDAPLAGIDSMGELFGIANVTVAGTLQFQFSQVLAELSDTNLLENSCITAIRLNP